MRHFPAMPITDLRSRIAALVTVPSCHAIRSRRIVCRHHTCTFFGLPPSTTERVHLIRSYRLAVVDQHGRARGWAVGQGAAVGMRKVVSLATTQKAEQQGRTRTEATRLRAAPERIGCRAGDCRSEYLLCKRQNWSSDGSLAPASSDRTRNRDDWSC
jgi:hypothetical protein